MKLALLLLIPCIALGRVGEKLEDFKKRASAAVDVANYSDGIFRATALVDDIEVEMIGKAGVIYYEFYRGVSEVQARAIVGKLPNKFQLIEPGPEIQWRDGTTKLSCFYRKDILLIRFDSALKLRDAIDREQEKAGKPSVPKMEKF
jgi:hypothetical protein